MDLTLINRDGQFVADSRDVAQMTDTRHDHLLSKIDGFVRILNTDPNFRVSDFFIETTYTDSTGRILRRYDITRKGCDMVANKMTGEKGVLFTATYVTKFDEMERTLKQVSIPTHENIVPLSKDQALITLLRTTADLVEDHQEIRQIVAEQSEKIEQVERKVDEQITLDSGEQRKVQKAVAKRVYELSSEPKVQRELFRQLYREIKDRWAVGSYKDVR